MSGLVKYLREEKGAVSPPPVIQCSVPELWDSQAEVFRMLEAAANAENLTIAINEEGEEFSIPWDEVLIGDLVPRAKRLVSTVESFGPAENSLLANVCNYLKKWLNSPKTPGRAWNIRTGTEHLIQVIYSNDSSTFDRPIEDNGLPF